MAPGREANIAYSGKSIDLLHNNCMLSELIRIASKKTFLNICFIKLSEEFRRNTKTSSN